MTVFVGRSQELERMRQIDQRSGPHLIVIKGRRRIGKSRLAAEFAKNHRFLNFTGLPPTNAVTAQDQRDAFARQFALNFQMPPLTFTDWTDAFNHLTLHIPDTPTVILFDEISWMGSKDPAFVGKLKIWWDLYLQRFPNLTLIFCGSVSTWIEQNILNSTAFFGRVSLEIELGPLSLPECTDLLKKQGFKGSVYEIFEILSITGGIPWYLEKIDPGQPAGASLMNLCFTKGGLLVQEFDRIFHDLFGARAKTYGMILEALSTVDKTLAQIREAIDYPSSGTLSQVVRDLITSGFVSEHAQWSLKTGALSRQSLYRLSDCYVRFYLKYIAFHRPKIEKGTYAGFAPHQLPGWDAMMGIQMESLLLQNRPLLLKALHINPMDVVNDNPYHQRKTTRHRGCQIDYLVQTNTRNLYVCEFKCQSRPLGLEVIDALKEKIERLSLPRGFGVAPVLFYLGDVSPRLYESGYFYRIIDCGDFLS